MSLLRRVLLSETAMPCARCSSRYPNARMELGKQRRLSGSSRSKMEGDPSHSATPRRPDEAARMLFYYLGTISQQRHRQGPRISQCSVQGSGIASVRHSSSAKEAWKEPCTAAIADRQPRNAYFRPKSVKFRPPHRNWNRGESVQVQHPGHASVDAGWGFVKSYVDAGYFQLALDFFNGMVDRKHFPTSQMLQDMIILSDRPTGLQLSAILFCRWTRQDETNALDFWESRASDSLRFHPTVIGRIIDVKLRSGYTDEALELNKLCATKNSSVPAWAWTSLVFSLSAADRFDEALKIYREKEAIYPFALKETAMVALFSACTEGGSLEELRYLHKQLGPEDKPNIVWFTALIHGYFTFHDPHSALQTFERMLERGVTPDWTLYMLFINTVSRHPYENTELLTMWYEALLAAGLNPSVEVMTNMLACFARESNTVAAEFYFGELLRQGSKPDLMAYTAVMYAYARLGDVENTEKWYRRLIANEIRPDGQALCALITAYAKARDFSAARKLFEQLEAQLQQPTSDSIPDADSRLVMYNTMISELIKAGEPDSAMWFLRQMMHMGLPPDTYTCVAIINGYAQAGSLRLALRFYHEMIQGGMVPNNHVYSSLATILAQCRASASEVQQLVEDIGEGGVQPDMATWTALMFAFGRAKEHETVITMWTEIGIRPNDLDNPGEIAQEEPLFEVDGQCFMMFVRTCLDLSRRAGGMGSEKGRAWVDRIVKDGQHLIDRNLVINARTWQLLIDGLVYHGAPVDAAKIALLMLQRLTDLVSTQPPTEDTNAYDEIVSVRNVKRTTEQEEITAGSSAGATVLTEFPGGKCRTTQLDQLKQLIKTMKATKMSSQSISPHSALEAFCDGALRSLSLHLRKQNHGAYLATLHSQLTQLREVYPETITRETLALLSSTTRHVKKI
ncbi:hypothetical protein DFJ77DRAFT_455257 [Powellomyces hirtus]|nr:hypothetical protein DFJ77DRAFT_455257 [Powellomyces hirtus]